MVRVKDAILDESFQEAMTLKCALCGQSYIINPRDVEEWQYTYCSPECRDMDLQIQEEEKNFAEK